MSIEKKSETFKITRQLIKNADIITLATSPLFMKQDEALSIIQQLLQ